MAKAIEQKGGLMIGHAGLGLHGDATGTVRQQVHDGDTVIVQANGNLGVRFLGVDAPEISFTLPNEKQFLSISNPRWENFLTAPFAPQWGPFDGQLSAGLRNHLQAHIGPGTATNHHEHALAAERELEKDVKDDIATLGKTEETFQFFLVFANEVMDRYGRLLCFINRDQPNANQPSPRPRSYNERLLQMGLVVPYAIWPNINPFRRKPSVAAAVIPPRTANDLAKNDPTLREARTWVGQARQQQIGVFDVQNPLRLLPFELRFLAQRRRPNRWVIDLSKNDDVLIQPENYFTVPSLEDRLFIPEEYVALFVEAGWKRQAAAMAITA